MNTKKVVKTKTKDRGLTEEKLLSAAEEVISQFGFKGATTRLIAKKASINLSLINRYFDGKYGLFISMIEKKIMARKSQELTYPPQKTLEDELCKYGDFLFQTLNSDKNMLKIIMGQFFSDSKFLKKFRNVVPLVIGNPQLEIRLQKLIEEGKMTPQYSLPQIIDDLETQAVSLCLFKIIVHDRDVKEVSETYRNFILRYAKSLKAD